MRSKRMELRRLKQLLLCCIDRCRCPQIQDAFLDSSFLIIPTYTHPWFNPKVWTYLWSLRSDVCHWGFCHWVNQRPHTWASVKLKSYQYWFPGPGPNPSGRTRYIPIRIVLVFKQDCRTSDSFSPKNGPIFIAFNITVSLCTIWNGRNCYTEPFQWRSQEFFLYQYFADSDPHYGTR